MTHNQKQPLYIATALTLFIFVEPIADLLESAVYFLINLVGWCMRDIKFRAWDKGNFEMFTYDDIGDVVFGLENDGTVSLFICDSEESPDIDVMQFTGLTDKDFNDIYHKDIIIDHVGIGVIVWCDKNCSFKVSYRGEDKGYGKWFRDYLDSELKTIEVIGNIYENPELLEVQAWTSQTQTYYTYTM